MGKMKTAQKMNIGECAKIAQCSVETVRYYEKQGLLPEAERGANNYRVYGPEHVRILTFIRNCRALDMSQEEIQMLLRFKGCPEHDCGAVNTLLDEHIAHVDRRIAELRRLKGELTALRRKCQSTRKVRDCRILEGLAGMRPQRKSPHFHGHTHEGLHG